ncbi:MAG: hypothetical protein AAFZ87_18490 [Planctomycetota bacterium]
MAFEAAAEGPPRKRREVVELVDRVVTEVSEAGPLEGAGPRDLFGTFAGPLELDADALRRACNAFNGCAVAERRAFFELVVERRTLDDAARTLGEDAVRIARNARRALDVALEAAGAPGSAPTREAASPCPGGSATEAGRSGAVEGEDAAVDGATTTEEIAP